MRIAFIADSRSEHTRNWLKYFVGIGDEILLLSTFSGPEISGVKTYFLPGLFRIRNAMVIPSHLTKKNLSTRVVQLALNSNWIKTLDFIWQQTRSLDVLLQVKEAKAVLKKFQPDLVHALRIQNEGYVGAWAKHHPLILSSWGSDFIYIAKRFPVHRILTRLVMRKPDAFMADCLRDIRLAYVNGLPNTVPTRCFPGNGGIDRALFHNSRSEMQPRERIILFARGYSPLTCIDTLLEAFKILLDREQSQLTQLILLLPTGAISKVERIRQKLNISKSSIQIKTGVSREEMGRLLQTIAVIVSPMKSDGTPNSMLEAMACGAFPVMSDLESIREWISHGQNGLLFNPDNPEELAACLEEALDNFSLCQSAKEINEQLINDRVDYVKIMPQVREFYQMIANEYKIQLKPNQKE